MKFPTIEPLEARIAPAVISLSAPTDSPKNEGSAISGTTDFVFKITLDAAMGIADLGCGDGGTAGPG